MKTFKGIPVSNGIAIAKILLLKENKVEISKEKINEDEINFELEKFEKSKLLTIKQLESIVYKTRNDIGNDEAMIFEAHLEMVQDPMIEESVLEKVKSELKNIVLAIEETKNEVASIFDVMEDEYLKERSADVKDVCNRMINNILGLNTNQFEELNEEVIVVAKDLTPSDTASMNFKYVKGFATDLGGKTAHTSIMARTLEIPAVVGLSNITENCLNGQTIILDGKSGNIFINPTEEIINEYVDKKNKYLEEKKIMEQLKNLESVTLDGTKVELAANIGSQKDIEGVIRNGAEAIGLFRTEFLYMDGKEFPSEEIQFLAYKEVAEKMENKPVIIRTLDIGGDKELSYFDFGNEMNPFLGYRALRICLDKIDIFKSQLRALLRASNFGNIRIMFPMVISAEEILKSKEILEECKKELDSENLNYDKDIKVGIMVETPASAIMCDSLAKYVDFFSIGTNDLTQYILAVDRGNEKISSLYDSFHPAVLRSIKNVIDASHREGKFTGMCGEFAGDPKATLLLLGMGLDEFSMSSSSIPYIKKIIRETNFSKAKEIADKVLKMSTSTEINEFLNNI